jgi:SNF2 family DNA or RNA helicase
MIHLRFNRLTWSERDELAMARVLGADHAIKGWAPPLASILRAAKRRHVRLSPEADDFLRQAIALRIRLRDERRRDDDATSRDAFADKLFPHQRADLAYLHHAAHRGKLNAFLLAHDPGVGKTPAAIRWAMQLDARRILVIAPNSAKEQWTREIRRWTKRPRLPVTIVEGTIKEQFAQLQRKEGWIVAHWEALVHARNAVLVHAWDAVIGDEAHKMANRNAQRSGTMFDLHADWKLLLTAHPFVNDPDEFWSLLHFLYPKDYSSFWRYFGQHVKAKPARFGGMEIIGTRNAKLLKWEVAPFVVRRTKRQVFKNLPPIARVPRHVSLSPAGRREYDKLRKQFFVELKKERDETRILAIPSTLARVMRLRQYLIDPGILGAREPSVKYPEVLELLGELNGPLVLFSSFRQAAERCNAFLTKHGKRTALIAGGQTARQRERVRQHFLHARVDCVTIVTQAGGESLNFGKYGYVAHLDLPWTPKDFEQTEGRVDRPEEGTGKLVPTTSYRIVVRDSYEEKMEAKLEKKHGKFREVFTVSRLKELFS